MRIFSPRPRFPAHVSSLLLSGAAGPTGQSSGAGGAAAGGDGGGEEETGAGEQEQPDGEPEGGRPLPRLPGAPHPVGHAHSS